MGQLLPDRYPNRDFFIVDVKDASPKDEMASMEHPIYSLSTKPDRRQLNCELANGGRLQVLPSAHGLATIMDKDIVLYCISKLVAEKNAGKEMPEDCPVLELSGHEIMVACNWLTSKHQYRRFREALIRLHGTQLITDVETGGAMSTKMFHLIEEAEIVGKKDGKEHPFGRLSQVRIKLSDFTYRAVKALEVLSINPTYFRLRRPLERRLYEIARKHVGNQSDWEIGLEKLQAKVGTNAPLKKFRYNLKVIGGDGNIPDYRFCLNGNGVVIQSLSHSMAKTAPETPVPTLIPLGPETLDKAQAMAAQIGRSLHDLRLEWNEWSLSRQADLKTPDGAFLAFCAKKRAATATPSATGANEIHHASLDGAGENGPFRQLGLALPSLSGCD